MPTDEFKKIIDVNNSGIMKEVSPWINNPYVKAATSDNTRKAYRSDIRHFEAWGGRLPATPEMIIHYLGAHAEKLNARTLARRLIALRHWHTYQDFPDPTLHPSIVKTLTGILRVHGKPKDKAPALTVDELARIVTYLHTENSFAAFRDNALLQIGFFGALRRSELVAIAYEHIKWEKEGIEILLPESKGDQTHAGQYCVVPYGNETLCPILALKNWLTRSHITQGAIFRRITLGDHIGSGALTPLSVNLILKNRATAAGIPHADKLSSHSLRRGLATSAARAKSPLHAIMRAGRWKQTNTVMEYIEGSDRFNENAASDVLQQLRMCENQKRKT